MRVRESILRETSTLGVRATRVERTVLDRELREVATPYGPVRVKIGSLGGRPLHATPEFEDCRAAAHASGVPVQEVIAAALASWRSVSAA